MSTSPHFASSSSGIEPMEPPAGLASNGRQGRLPPELTFADQNESGLPAVTRTDNFGKREPMIEAIELPGESLPEVPILALSVHDSDDQVFAALCAGAAVYWLTSSPPAHLLDSLRQVASGGAPMSPEIAGRVVAMFRELRRPAHADYRLTPQESTLLRLLVDGRHRKTAAKAMGISVNTVSFHLKNIYVKLQVHSKTEAVAKALRERLL